MAFKGDPAQAGLMLSGQQILIPETDLFITQPTINQIVIFGEDDFLTGINLLIKNKNLIEKVKMGNPELRLYPDFQLFMIALNEEKSLRSIIEKVFTLIFPNYVVEIKDSTIAFFIEDTLSTEDENGKIIEENTRYPIGQLHMYNFENFQNLLNDLFQPHGGDEELNREFNPADDAAARIAKKLERGRAQRSQAQGPQSLFGIYCSTLSIGLQMDVRIFFEYTPFQLYDAYIRFFEKQKSDFYTRVSTMPFMDASKMDTPKEWSRNLY